MPTRKDLARWLVHAAKNKIPLSGFADHLVSESVYLDDPEGNGIEVYADRAPETWKWDGGSVAMATDQLDIDGLLALTDTHTTNYAKAPDDLRIGHMHLRVGDLEQADRFYGGAIGFDPTRKRSGAAFLSSGRYHHHLGDQRLAERRRRPARRYGHRACVVFAGDRGGGDSAGPNAAPAAGGRAGRGDREWHRDIRSLGHEAAADQGLMLSAIVDQPCPAGPDRPCEREAENEVRPGQGASNIYFFLPEPKVGCQPAGLLAWCCGNHLDLLFLGFLGFPIASLLAFGHVDLPGLMVTSELNAFWLDIVVD